jgi:selenocysteine-specific elongation factor
VVIGTAGHVDHGKTALVRALTGTETDRLAEERRRGITIELGFARCALPGVEAGIVDVPGHEDFVRTMVAGATGVDVALLVVAADESVMPQTLEHAAILDFLAIPVGVVAITKADLVDPAWLDLVEAEIRERLADSQVSWEAVVPVSSVTGMGVEALRAALAAAATRARGRRADDLFRLPVDRAFSVAGAGTVVTGTVWTGSVRAGDEVRVLPGEERARVRSVQSHGVQQDVAEPGRRTALALTGLSRAVAERGTTVVAGEGWRITDSLDAVVTLLPDAPPLGQRTRVRVHLGTVEVMARVTPGGDGVPAGGTGPVRLRLEAPTVARWGDRIVLRAYSPVMTIGGGLVADPWPAARPRRPAGLDALLEEPGLRIAAAVLRAGSHGLPVTDLPVRLGVPPTDVVALVDAAAADGHAVRIGDRLLHAPVFEAAKARLVGALRAFHAANRLEPGMPREALRRVVSDPVLADAATDRLVADAQCAIEGQTVRLLTHEVRLEGEEAAAVAAVRNAVTDAGFEGKSPEELAGFGGALAPRAALEFLVRAGEVVRIGRDRYVAAGIIQTAVERVRQELAKSGQVGPAQLRDLLGLTRKYSIPLLEWFDAQSYTVRQGDVRVAGPRLTGRSGIS